MQDYIQSCGIEQKVEPRAKFAWWTSTFPYKRRCPIFFFFFHLTQIALARADKKKFNLSNSNKRLRLFCLHSFFFVYYFQIWINDFFFSLNSKGPEKEKKKDKNEIVSVLWMCKAIEFEFTGVVRIQSKLSWFFFPWLCCRDIRGWTEK